MKFQELLKSKEFVLLDGAMGTLIQKSGATYERVPEELSLTDPDLIASFHQAYIEAGADIVYSNTFGANPYKMLLSKYDVPETVAAAVACARQAVDAAEKTTGRRALVALDIGPIGQLLEPAGALSFDSAYEYFKEMVLAGTDADVVIIETMTDLLEVKAAVLAVKENAPDMPVLVTLTYERNGRTFTGVSPAAAAVTLTGLGVDAIGVNCSLGPDELGGVIKELSEHTTLPLIAKPNAGLPDPNSSEYDILPPQFAEDVLKLLPYGVKLCGGCCGTTPEYISTLRDRIEKACAGESAGKESAGESARAGAGEEPLRYVPPKGAPETEVCSASTVVRMDGPRIVGECINPTGKDLLQQALQNNDIDFILSLALGELEAGAEILDVNVGMPGLDETAIMQTAVKAIQSVCDSPLQLDATKPEVMEAGLRHYNGKPIVNSVNGEEASLSTILPLAKKYGAAVIGLTLDENGIPKTVDERMTIAKRIVERAEAIGIPRRDVYIDCLVLTVSAEQAAARQTLEALHRVKTELGCKTVLGVSNISFGLPNRDLVNTTFLTMALEEGLDLPIMNPHTESMTGAVRAFRVLAGLDENSLEFIEKYKSWTPESERPFAGKDSVAGAAGSEADSAAGAEESAGAEAAEASGSAVFKAVCSGLQSQGAAASEAALGAGMDPMVLVNEDLIPALDKVGMDFESGNIFLPQLIQSANAAQACFDVIKKYIAKEGGDDVSKGKVILATVKGDIHDIGKNIVKVLLDNYGYTVVDLGKDVDPALIVKTAAEQDIIAVGLSALMTTSLAAMEETIRQLRACPDLQNADGSSKVTVMVGGAVLTPEYAEAIGADHYCKDAKATVDCCKDLFGK
ncbi:MAG: homocysteine S-methyltransferase family protein [Clostridia bacterium]|nr:homocysteine S-methyltransferase family protein [Clostridia bacterium]